MLLFIFTLYLKTTSFRQCLCCYYMILPKCISPPVLGAGLAVMALWWIYTAGGWSVRWVLRWCWLLGCSGSCCGCTAVCLGQRSSIVLLSNQHHSSTYVQHALLVAGMKSHLRLSRIARLVYNRSVSLYQQSLSVWQCRLKHTCFVFNTCHGLSCVKLQTVLSNCTVFWDALFLVLLMFPACCLVSGCVELSWWHGCVFGNQAECRWLQDATHKVPILFC